MRTLTDGVRALSFLVILCAIVVSCGKSPSEGSKAFSSAAPEIKAAWGKGLAEAKAKDYAAAMSTLQDLHRNPALTPEQVKALEQATTAISDEMYEAANKGDAKAAEAIKQLRNTQRR